MKIAIFTNNYLPNYFGVSTSIESFRLDFERMGHTVYVFAPQAVGYADANRNVFRYPSFDLNYKISFPLAIPYSWKIGNILEKLEIDIIHSQHPNLLGYAARRWAKKKKVPLVFTWHTLYDRYAHFVPPFIPRKLAAWWTITNAVTYANRSDFVVTPTSSVEKIIKEWGVSNGNISSIPTGVDTEKFDRSDGNVIRKKYGIADDKIVLTIVSRFTEEKNIGFLFGAVVPILRKRKDVVFLAKGSGNLLPEMKEYVSGQGLENRVIFAEEGDRKEDVFVAGDIFVYSSKSETQGMVIAEAMYCGLPVVAVRATGVSDQVMDGASGFLVSEDADEFVRALEKIIDDEELRRRFSENAMKIARENYTGDICAKNMLKLYEDAISQKNNRI
ncbi:MAG: Glycosyltransferase [Candidatus Moranbacteria bacterium GW2011_GWE2_47_10]|nr:MAG: Glycosyltransferase [Candidatus Moranbacteria bacterium GW2011_GWE2_47_10]HBP00950.1 hypothetical protein [Candidatus Moranbacteria bacterium]